MRLNFKQLKKLPVETMSGTRIGKVQDIVMDLDDHGVVQYIVKSSLGSEEYTIGRDQIARFEEKRIVVYDTVIKKKEKGLEKILPKFPETEVAMRKTE